MKEIPLSTPGLVALVDDEDYEALVGFRWRGVRPRHTWYAQRHEGAGSVYMHRAIMAAPPHLQVDHRDSNGLNNQRANLRLATSTQNSASQRKTRGVSKYKGVSWYRPTGRWKVDIQANRIKRYVGYFDDEDEAAAAYLAAAKELFGEFARGAMK